jgi:protein required for attachment to host cells
MQASPELLELIYHLRMNGFKLNLHHVDHHIAIDVEDGDGVTLNYLSTSDDDEASIFMNFAAQVKETYAWDDDDLYESKMREKFRQARQEMQNRSDWDQADVDRVARIAKAELQGAKDRGQHSEYLFLTPERAEDLLLRHHKERRRRGLPDPEARNDGSINIIEATQSSTFINQRKQSKPHGKGIKGIIKRGDFLLIHQGAAIDPQGFIFDGFHRIEACAEGIYPVAIEITWNANPLTMPAIDTGKPRLFGDVLSMYGVANANNVGQVVRLLYNIDHHPDNFARWNDKHDPQELTRIFSEDYLRAADSYKAAAAATSKASNKLSTVALAAAHFMITRTWPLVPIEPFMNSIRGPFPDPFYNTRYNTHRKQEEFPVLKLIDWAASDADRAKRKDRRLGVMGQMGPSHYVMILRAWNHACVGKTLDRYTWVDVNAVPEIIGMS